MPSEVEYENDIDEEVDNHTHHSSRTNELTGVKAQLEWIKRQLEYSSYTDKYELRLPLKKGEIYEFDWGINVNCEFSNRHYGVVLADSNEFNPLVIVCPLKTNKYGPHPKSDIDLGHIEGLGTPYASLAVVNQIRSIDKVRIYTKTAIGERKYIDESNIVKLDEAVVDKIIEGYFRYLKTNSVK